jgi:hypothetical protein
MSVRAKFTCTEKTETAEGMSVKLFPVIEGSEENKAFYRWTPSGSIVLATVNKDAAAQFIVGKQYYVDFTLPVAVEVAAEPQA